MYLNSDKVSYSSGIYKITNKTNNKFYIGSSKDLIYRFKTHKRQLKNGEHYNPHLQRSWDKYDSSDFKFKIILYCENDNLRFYEQKFLNKINFEKLYNISKDANSPMRGRKMPEDLKNYFSKLYSGEGNPRYGVSLDCSVKNQISKSLINYHKNNENAFKGEKHTKKSKQKMKGSRPKSKGVKNGRSKLSKENVQEIKYLLNNTNKKQSDIADKFGVCDTVISNINVGKSYKNIKAKETNNA